MSLQRLISIWCVGDTPSTKVSRDDLDQAERALRFIFPEDYRQAILSAGVPQMTSDPLDYVDKTEFGDIPFASAFLLPDEIVEDTPLWRQHGLCFDLVIFALNSNGTLLCFSTGTPDRTAGTVWMWSIDYMDEMEIAESFDAWVESMCAIKRV